MSDKRRVVLIDADGLIYHSSKETLQESLDIMTEKINNIFEKTDATHYAMFVSSGKYFRHDLYPEYKIKRGTYGTPLKWLDTLKAYLIEHWGAAYISSIEADDAVCYYYYKGYSTVDADMIIASPDKDLLKNIPGAHFNYTYKLPDKTDVSSLIKGNIVVTTVHEAQEHFWMQMIVGDITDGVKGIEGKGPVAAKAMLDKAKESNEDYRLMVLSAYISRYGEAQGIYEFQKNYRLLHMLAIDSDVVRETNIAIMPGLAQFVREIPVKTGEFNELKNAF